MNYSTSRLPMRFWAKVLCDTKTQCWNWTGATSVGYGHFHVPAIKARRLAHRVAYEAFVGPIPKGLVVHHACYNTACVNPEHLRIVTQQRNILMGSGATAQHARQTHCVNGHPFDKTNTYVRRDRNGGRECRACNSYRKAMVTR